MEEGGCGGCLQEAELVSEDPLVTCADKNSARTNHRRALLEASSRLRP